MSSTIIFTGRKITIPAGTLVKSGSGSQKRKAPSAVTVRKHEPARDGKTRVYWKSNGVIVSALIK